MNKLRLKQSFKADDFLNQYWQQKPVLLAGLVSEFKDPVSPEELAGLACEEFVESRLVKENAAGNWELSHGPFTEIDFTSLPDSNWTLLVQAVDQWLGNVADIKNLFDFIPSWRVDDLMISYATPGGGVGPHFDYYDVFLLQGQGQRRWQVGNRCPSNSALRENSALGILQDFEPVNEYLLNPGDVLYIPPRYSHWGIAESNSVCYSIGFRAPSEGEMIEGFSDFLIREQDPAMRYEDTLLQPAERRGEIDVRQLEGSFQQLLEQFSNKVIFAHWFGCYVTQAKYPDLIHAPETLIADEGELLRLAEEDFTLSKNPSSRFAFIESGAESCVLLFVDGSMVRFEMESLEAVSMLCNLSAFTSENVQYLLTFTGLKELLRQLINQGSLQIP